VWKGQPQRKKRRRKGWHRVLCVVQWLAGIALSQPPRRQISPPRSRPPPTSHSHPSTAEPTHYTAPRPNPSTLNPAHAHTHKDTHLLHQHRRRPARDQRCRDDDVDAVLALRPEEVPLRLKEGLRHLLGVAGACVFLEVGGWSARGGEGLWEGRVRLVWGSERVAERGPASNSLSS